MAVTLLAQWSDGFYKLFGDIYNYTELYITYGSDEIVADNLMWDFEPEEDLTERREQYRDLLVILLNSSQPVDTDTVTGVVFDITDEFDWTSEGTARSLYTLKAEDNGTAYAANASDFTRLVKMMSEYTESDAES